MLTIVEKNNLLPYPKLECIIPAKSIEKVWYRALKKKKKINPILWKLFTLYKLRAI